MVTALKQNAINLDLRRITPTDIAVLALKEVINYYNMLSCMYMYA